MIDIIAHYWPHILAVLSVLLGAPAAIHAAMTKDDVRSAVGWVGIILLSPVVGALLYYIAGINRIRRQQLRDRRHPLDNVLDVDARQFEVTDGELEPIFGERAAAMVRLGDHVTRWPVTSGNSIELLSSGDETYAAMLDAVAKAERSILMETYIFDRDGIGKALADRLGEAVSRGVEVRVLVDAVGARYSTPSILGYLRSKGVRADVFNGNVIVGLRLPYANLRVHRKILTVDGSVGFVGGMNIRDAFRGPDSARDTHFRVRGPIVGSLFTCAAEDWHFATGETLDGPAWKVAAGDAAAKSPVFMRAVQSGPDRHLEANQKMLLGAFSVAKHSIRIMSPYFLPDKELISALATAARRGVDVEIIVPSLNNLMLVDRAMTAQFDQLIKEGCRIYRSGGVFNHSKLLCIDGGWSFVGSSNIDSRSLRLNFEIDLEVFDADFANMISKRIGAVIERGEPVTLKSLHRRPFLLRLFDRILWLGSPYL
ncbi:cardiolipin synthase [Rhizobium sp. NRK18]|uniref:cardiolipin synthase n=1 Tax=Rhizobium sp. NRK18 TaxID=2964667 RepID=UPI0021C47B59|nr:cardiolipin synthase [Rhizobium sp. NRK18]MCQ2003766.1 cardiolipin synthase [Rhizobium sp. NRK18]